MEDSTMDDGASSLFVPQGTPEGNAPPSKRGEESGIGNGNGTGMVRVKSEHNTPEFQPNQQATLDRSATRQAFWDGWESKVGTLPGANNDPQVKEQSLSPPRPHNAFPPVSGPPRPFAPLTSRAERNRRNAANGPPNHDLARIALEAARRELQAAAQLASLAARNASMHNVVARTADNGPPNQALASTALETGSRDLQTAVQLAGLADRNASMHNDIARNALQGNAPTQPATRNNEAPPGPQPAQPATLPPTPMDLLRSAHHHLDTLTADLRKQENDACDREEHLTALLDQARDIRWRAIQDRRNGLVVIQDRDRKLRELETKLVSNEGIDDEEMLELLRPLKLGEPNE